MDSVDSLLQAALSYVLRREQELEVSRGVDLRAWKFRECTEIMIFASRPTQRLQYPLIEEYTLNHIRDPTMQ